MTWPVPSKLICTLRHFVAKKNSSWAVADTFLAVVFHCRWTSETALKSQSCKLSCTWGCIISCKFCLCFIGKFLPLKTMLGPRYDDQVAEENRFHPSMLSNYLKSLKVKWNFLLIEMLLLLLMLTQTLLFRFKKNGVDGFLWDVYRKKIFNKIFFKKFLVYLCNSSVSQILFYYKQELYKILQLICCVTSKNLTLFCYYCHTLVRCHCQNLDNL